MVVHTRIKSQGIAAIYQVMVAQMAETVTNLQGEVARIATAGLHEVPAQNAQAVVASRTTSLVTPAVARKLKKVFQKAYLIRPLLTIRGHYGRQSAGISYSHHEEIKMVVFLRQVITVDPTLFGGTSLDTILGEDTDGRLMTQLVKMCGNTRSKFNEHMVMQCKKLDDCTKSIGIRDGETPSVAMGERLIEFTNVVSGTTQRTLYS